MTRKTEMDLKAVLACPACAKDFIYAYSDSKGHASVPCVRCGRIIMADYETLEATLISPERRQNNRKYTIKSP